MLTSFSQYLNDLRSSAGSWMPQRQPSAEAMAMAALLKTPVANTGDWLARNEAFGRAQSDYKRQRQAVGDNLNQAFYDATRGEANKRLKSVDPNSMAAQIYSAMANNASQAMVPGATFQLPTGDQQTNFLNQLASQGGAIGDGAFQMAADNDYLAGIGRDGLYSSGSLNGFMNMPIGYKSMGIEGRTPWKTYQNIDSPDSIAYGGDGSQAAVGLQLEALKNFRWNQDAVNRYNQSMNNKNPLGSFIGGQVQRGPGLPGVDANGWIPDWVPDGKYSPQQLSDAIRSYDKSQGYYSGKGVTQMGDPTKGSGEKPMQDYQVDWGTLGGGGNQSLSNGGWVDSGAFDNGGRGWAAQSGANPGRFDPTVASEAYQPKMGNMAGWGNYLNSNPYQDRQPHMLSLADAAKKVAGVALGPLKGAAQSWMPQQQAPKPFGKSSFSNDALGGNDVMSFPAFSPMFGMAEAPKMVQQSTVSSYTKNGKPFSAQDFSAGALNPVRGFGGASLDPYYMGDYQQLFNKNFGTSWDYQRANDGGFGRWQTNPFSAGRVNAAMGGF